ncbi:MAG: hypothetical protein ACR2Q3_12050 [Woeseiaceae bacterium]
MATQIVINDEIQEASVEWTFVLGLSGITLLVIGVVIYFGMKLNKAVLKPAPEMTMPLYITPVGTVLWACVVGCWLICIIAVKLRPETPLGAFAGTADGAGLVFIGSIVIAAVAASILEKLGYPVATRGEES